MGEIITRRRMIELGILAAVGVATGTYEGLQYQERGEQQDSLKRPDPRQEVIKLTQDNLEEILKESDRMPIFIELWSEWCGPCKIFTPIYKNVAAEFSSDAAVFAEYNVDDKIKIKVRNKYGHLQTRTITDHWNIHSVPRVIILYKRPKDVVYQGEKIIKVSIDDLSIGNKCFIDAYSGIFDSQEKKNLALEQGRKVWEHELKHTFMRYLKEHCPERYQFINNHCPEQ